MEQQDKLVITYPPTFDGELHVNAKHEGQMYAFDFRYTDTGSSSSWEALVKAAQDILEADQRQKDEAISSKTMEQLFFDTFGIEFSQLKLCEVQARDMCVRYSLGSTIYKYAPTIHSWTTDPNYPF